MERLIELEDKFTNNSPARSRAQVSADNLMEKAQARIGNTIELIKTAADIDQLRHELRKWIENLRLEADGRVTINWKTDAIRSLMESRQAS